MERPRPHLLTSDRIFSLHIFSAHTYKEQEVLNRTGRITISPERIIAAPDNPEADYEPFQDVWTAPLIRMTTIDHTLETIKEDLKCIRRRLPNPYNPKR